MSPNLADGRSLGTVLSTQRDILGSTGMALSAGPEVQRPSLHQEENFHLSFLPLMKAPVV